MSDDLAPKDPPKAEGNGQPKCSCGGKGARLISIGTIRVRCDVGNSTIKVFFAPAKNFAVSHADKEYVALVPANGNSGCGILAPYDSKKGLPLNCGGSCSGLIEAAINQCAVEIEVGDKCKNCSDGRDGWPLCSITIPAAGQTK